MEQLHWEVFCNNLSLLLTCRALSCPQRIQIIECGHLFWFPSPIQFRRCDVMWCVSVCMMEMSVSIRTQLQDPGVKCYKTHLWWSRNNVAFPALPTAIVDGKKWIQNSLVGQTIFSVSFASGTLDIATWELYFICPQMLAAKGPRFRAQISASQPTLPASTTHKKKSIRLC